MATVHRRGSMDEYPGHDESQPDGFEPDFTNMTPHKSVGFWHHRMSKVRRHVIQLWFRTGTSKKTLII